MITRNFAKYSEAHRNCRLSGMSLGSFEDAAESSFVLSNSREKYGYSYWESLWRGGSTPEEDSKLVRRISDAMRSRFNWYSTGRGGYNDEKCPIVDNELARLLETRCFFRMRVR
ncbi:hypothetical protein ANCCAN_05780 [Ancylostoma caninum]|uniref:C-type lectin domain-containing protein n=1 Tax=Ancylostoma caninum TaxID=29170 RepID=A0A368GYK8_ANCCA|nr:hypothetical protein ANCCAN_05780 [Ancylostoma caninum]